MTLTPSSFEYYTPSTIIEAIDLLGKYGDDAKILAGGQSLIPLLKLRLASIRHLIDISRIEDMDYIREDSDTLGIGSLTTVEELESSKTIRRGYKSLQEAAEQIADPLVRNLGTVGGNVSHGDPSNDLPSVMLSLGATFMVQGKGGRREIRAEDFFIDSLTTALEPDEILYEVRVPKTLKGQGTSYVKHKKPAGDFSVAAAASNVIVDSDGRINRVGVGLTSVGPTQIKSKKAEELLVGQKLTEELASKVAREIAEESDPASDFYGSVEYKKKVLRWVVKESLMTAYDRANGV